MVRPKSLQSDGFTLVELMIASIIFSIILVLITVGVVHFTTSYYRSVNTSTTQNIGRSAMAEITQAIQFSASAADIHIPGAAPSPSTTGYFCVGNDEFAYNAGQQLPGSYALYHFNNSSAGTCVDPQGNDPTPPHAPVTSSAYWKAGHELLGDRMRLVAINVHGDSGMVPKYAVALTVAFGDADLLCSPAADGHSGGCIAGDVPYASGATLTASDLACKSQAASQFCYVTSLQTVIGRRLP